MNLNHIFNRVFHLIALLAVAMMMVPFSLMLLNGTFPNSSQILTAVAIFGTFFGYIVQYAVAKAAHKTASSDGFGVIEDGILSGFSLKYAGIPITIFVLLSIPVLFLHNSVMQRWCDAGIVSYTTIIYAILMATIFLTSCIMGCVIWFYPIERLANIYILLTGAAIFFIEFVLAIVTSQPRVNTVSVLGVAFAVYLVCMLIVFNQNSLQQKYRGSVVSVMTPSARMYNLFLVFVLFLCVLALSAVSYVFLSGFYLIGKIILVYVMYKFFYTSGASETEYYEYAYLDGDEAAELFMKNAMMDRGDRVLLSYFFAGTLTLLAVIVGLKSGILRKAFAAIKAWIKDFFTTIFIGAGIFKISFDPDTEDEIHNYKDEKKKLQKAEIRDFAELADSTESYKLFLQRLGKLETYEEQLCYAYAILIRMYKKMNIPIKSSDTPRETEKKVSRALTEREIERITQDFESVRYAEVQKSDAEAAAILNNICTAVKRYLY